MSFGEFLRARRLATGLTIKDVAESTGLSVTILTAAENPHRRPPPQSNQRFYTEVARVIGIAPVALIQIAEVEREDDLDDAEAPSPAPGPISGLATTERAQFVRHIARLNREIDRLRAKCGES